MSELPSTGGTTLVSPELVSGRRDREVGRPGSDWSMELVPLVCGFFHEPTNGRGWIQVGRGRILVTALSHRYADAPAGAHAIACWRSYFNNFRTVVSWTGLSA